MEHGDSSSTPVDPFSSYVSPEMSSNNTIGERAYERIKRNITRSPPALIQNFLSACFYLQPRKRERADRIAVADGGDFVGCVGRRSDGSGGTA